MVTAKQEEFLNALALAPCRRCFAVARLRVYGIEHSQSAPGPVIRWETMKALRRSVAAALVVLTAPATLAATKAWQDTLTLPTWLEGPPETVPRLEAVDPGQALYPYITYPYPVRLNFTKTREPQQWRRLNLENEYLSCSFLPDLGGRLYNCIDKLNGRPMFFSTPSIKKAGIAVRGAWVALGVEWNFPVAHSRDTVSPVNFGFRQEKDRAEVWIGDLDRVTGMEWLAEFVLRDGSAVLEENVTLRNPTAVRHPYSWWANAEVGLDEGTRFVYPVNVMSTPGLTMIESWPRSQAGTDFSNPVAAREEIAFFGYGSREPFFAIYNTKSQTAVVHVADPEVVPGKKLYSWGGLSKTVHGLLSDDNTWYVEMQAGLFENQETYQYLQPHQRIQFTERWLAGRELGGVTRANQHAILSFERRETGGKTALQVELNVTHAIPGAHIRVWNGASVELDQTADLTPSTKYFHAVSDPHEGAYRFELRDAAGALLMGHTEGVYEAVGVSDVKLGPQQPATPQDGAGGFLAAGDYHEKNSAYRLAEEAYRDGLAKFPNDAPLAKALGRLLAERQRYQEAAQLLSDVTAARPLDPELRYYLGLALLRSGQEDAARKSWAVSAQDSQFGPGILTELAALESRAGHADTALDLAVKAIARDKGSLTAWKLQVALLRHAGKADEARKRLDDARAIDPVDSFLRLEGIQLGANDDALWLHLAADPERVIEIAGAYFDFGMYRDAMTVLDHTYQAVSGNQTEPGAMLPQDYPLVAYYRGYCRQKLDQSGVADFKLAASQRLEYVFPSRAGSLAPLQAAIQENAQDSSAHFLLGLLYLNDNWTSNAVAELQAAKAIRKDIPELYFVLGGALLSSKGGKTAGLSVLQEGIAVAPSKELKDLFALAAFSPKASNGAALGAPPAVGPKPTTPTEMARYALNLAADGVLDQAAAEFTAQNFPQEKQPDAIRKAYIEVQLQFLRDQAAHHKCTDALKGAEAIGGEDKNLPFTLYGFDAFMKGARFQYYVGAVEALCGDAGAARRRWSKVAKMTPGISSSDFTFPILAAQNLAAKGKGPDIQPWLDKVSAALASAGDDARGTLLYSKGLLLLARGDEGSAVVAFQEGAQAPDGQMSRYLNNLVLREANLAVPAPK
jgi:tetratricopeptide (TPR) repeat protein